MRWQSSVVSNTHSHAVHTPTSSGYIIPTIRFHTYCVPCRLQQRSASGDRVVRWLGQTVARLTVVVTVSPETYTQAGSLSSAAVITAAQSAAELSSPRTTPSQLSASPGTEVVATSVHDSMGSFDAAQ